MTASWRVFLSAPDVDEETVEHVAAVLRSRTLSIGPELERFETRFAEFMGTRFAIGVNSGTSGLHLVVRALGLEAGDEVVTSPFSFIASANCLLFEGVVPRFVDIDPASFLMDLDATGAAIDRRTRGLLPVHIFGTAVDMERVSALAARSDLAVIEDSCEVIGGVVDGRRVGTSGDAGVFGFYPNKQMTTGEGGMIVTDREDVAQRVRSMRNQGRAPSGDGSFAELGYNYRLSELNAALGVMQLERLDGFLALRREREERYHELLGDIEELRLLSSRRPGRSPFVFIVQASSAGLRDALRERLLSRGIQCAIYFRSIHLEPFYRERFGYRPGAFPNAEHASATCLAIPFHNRIADEEQDLVATEMRAGVGEWLGQSCVPRATS